MLPLILLAAEVVVPKPPEIPDSLAVKFWRTQAQLISAQAELKAQEEKAAKIIADIVKACGENHKPIDQDGLKCVPKK